MKEMLCVILWIQWPWFFACDSPALLLDDSAGRNCQRALVDKSEFLINCAKQWACLPLFKRHLTNSNKSWVLIVPASAVKLIKWLWCKREMGQNSNSFYGGESLAPITLKYVLSRDRTGTSQGTGPYDTVPCCLLEHKSLTVCFM
jgi:hypothetical protein